jgi:simple sugar transport system ATP-binding protein
MSAGDYFVVLIQGQVAARFRRGEKSSVEVLSLMAGGEQIEDVAGEFAHLGKNDGISRPAAQG